MASVDRDEALRETLFFTDDDLPPVARQSAPRFFEAVVPADAADPDQVPYKCLFITDGNLLDDSAEAGAHRELFRALAGLGLACEVYCRFLVPGEVETEPKQWLPERGWTVADAPEPGASASGQSRAPLRMIVGDVPVTLFCGPSTKPHPPDDAERAAFLRLVEGALAGNPDVVLAPPGPCSADVFAAARARGARTVLLQPDGRPRDPAPFRDADVVLTPTRLAADYLREAFGLPCVDLPPVVAREQIDAEPATAGAVVFDASAPGNGLYAFIQIAEELARRRPKIPVLVIGGTGSLALPGGGSVQCVPARGLGRVWAAARVFLAPLAGWEHVPLTALSALAHGVPVIASDRGAAPELLAGAGLVLPLPERVTATVPALLTPAERAPWVEAVLRLYDDQAFAAGQRGLGLVAGQQWAADKVAPQYARFLSRLAQARRPRPAPLNGAAGARNGTAAAVRRLAETHPWPQQRPEDAAPGQEQGWLGAGTEVMLARVLSPATKLVVELGAWVGLSTRFIADHAPNTTIISVDHWVGSPEHQAQERFQKLLPRLFETFQARCWDYRDRVVPLRMNTLDGLRTVAESGLQPDFVYVDAEHSYQAVMAELNLARQLFPRAVLGGDDYDWKGVREAADAFARQHGLVVDRFGARGWRLLENWQAAEAGQPPPGRGQSVVLVPHMNGIEWECEEALRRLEGAGVRVVRRGGCSAIDVARNEMLSDALHDEAESILFVDSDIGFDPHDALRLLARPEPVVSGVYAKKGRRELASIFIDGVKEIIFGPEAAGPYPLKYAATGFLRVRAGVLRRLITDLGMPLCNTHWGRGVWPFFQPLIVPHGPGKMHYLGEDWAFSHRLQKIGVTPLADTSIRLWHWGRYGFSWEDAGSEVNRYRTYSYRFQPT
jgi:predicted O-methyltransferase YrrM